MGVAWLVTAAVGLGDVAGHTADIIQNNYYDAAKGAEVARELRRAADAGEFKRFTDPRDFATELTQRLRKTDRHFTVSWYPRSRDGASLDAAGADQARSTVQSPPLTPSLSPSSAHASPPITPAQLQERISLLPAQPGFGFRKVEVLPGGIGYIDLRYFVDFSSAKAADPARAAADAALQLISGTNAVILDLRYNGGGSSAMEGYLVSAFVKPDANVYNVIHRRDRTESERPALPYRNPRPDVPLYVLISGRTASAAEATAYTLQAAHRATIVGSKSVGAANPGGEFPLDNGFNVFVSTGTPVNPITGGNWEGVGVSPDVRVDSERALERVQMLALDTILARDPNGPGALEARWTLEAFRAEQVPPPETPPLAGYVGTYVGASIVKAGSSLILKRTHHGEMPLQRVRGDVFCVRGEPFRRVTFERDSAGTVRGFQLVRANGPSLWFPHRSVGTGSG